MKLLFCVLCFVLLSLTMAAEESTPVPWKIEQLPLDDQGIAGPGIAALIREGYHPIGLAVLENGMLSILAALKQSSEPQYFLKYFADLATASEEFASFLADGWQPAAIDFFGEGLLVLFITGEEELRAWKMESAGEHTSPNVQREARQLFESATEEGFTPFGLAEYRDQLWIGFTRSKSGKTSDRYVIDSYANDGDSFIAGINRRLSEGFSLNGFQFIDGSIYIAYLR